MDFKKLTNISDSLSVVKVKDDEELNEAPIPALDEDAEDEDIEEEEEEEEEDGWYSIPESLTDFFDKFDELEYEVKNCVKGCNTGCESYGALAEYIRNLAEELSSIADDVQSVDDVCDMANKLYR